MYFGIRQGHTHFDTNRIMPTPPLEIDFRDLLELGFWPGISGKRGYILLPAVAENQPGKIKTA